MTIVVGLGLDAALADRSAKFKFTNFTHTFDLIEFKASKYTITVKMTFSNVKAALCFKLCDDFGKKFSWNSFVNGVSKTYTLEDAIRKQDDIVTIKNTKIVPYLEAEGTLITQVCTIVSV